MTGKLYIVATPIGNLQDITLRALETLKSVNFILCEDTRVTKNLLNHYQINKPLISYHHHSDAKKVKEITKLLEEGNSIALVTDAGTPGISDPGNQLVSEFTRPHPALPSVEGRVNVSPSFAKEWAGGGLAVVIPIPGPSALIAALSVSGFPTDKFIFMGFPPHKNKRQKFFKEVAAAEHTVVFYESGHRISKCIKELGEVLDPKRQIVICRELTKMFESIYRGTIAEIINQKIDERGEFVIVISNY